MAGNTKVVEELLDSVTKHSIELQRVANKMQGAVAREFKKLASELDGIVAKHDFATPMSGAKRKAMLASAVREGKAAIRKSNLAMARVVKDKLIDVGNLETKFSVGSVNKAVTGKGTITFATETVPAKKISTMASNLIINGAPQKAMWSRQAVQLQNKFSDVIRNGWLNNQSIGTISQNIRGTAAAGFKDGIMNVSKHHANTLARTSISSIANQVREETYIANSDVVEGVQFLAVLDDDTTRVCRAHSGDKWKYTSAGWINVQGGHDYVQPPLHFNCRSTTIPLVFPAEVLAKTVPAKLDLIPKDRVKSMGVPLPPGLKKSVDADAWLAAQPVEYQQEVLGKAYTMWKAGDVSFKRFVTQKGRVRSTDELERLYAADEVIPKQVAALKSDESFRVNPKADQEFKDALKQTSKAEFLAIEERLLLGKSVANAEIDKLGLILRNADARDLEYAAGFKADNLVDLLGTKAKRLAFYNHTAKRFSRIPELHKGDLVRRHTSKLKDVDEQILKQLRDKIIADPKMNNRVKQILLEMFDEASQIVGTQRSLPMIESLFTLARKTDFNDIDEFVGYLNNSLKNSVNSYFARAKNLEIRIGATPEKVARYNSLSENAKTLQFEELNRKGADDISRAQASKMQRDLEKIAKRELRDFDGNKLTAFNVDMEISMRDNISLYLKYLSDDVRMSDDEIVAFMKRVSKQPRMNKAQRLHYDRVQFILNRTQSDTATLTDAVLNNPLFKNWGDNVWSGRGFPPAIRTEVGEVLGDVQIYRKLQKYLEFKNPGGEVLEDVIKQSRKVSTVTIERKVTELVNKDAKARKKLITEREARVETKINKEGEFAKLEREKAKLTRAEAVAKQREEAAVAWRDASDGDFVWNMAEKMDDLVTKNLRNPKSPFFTEAGIIADDNMVELAQLVNGQLFTAVGKGEQYVTVAKKLGRKYYINFKNATNIDEDDLIRMGHFLIESAVKSKIVKRTKVLMQIVEDGKPPRNVLSWRLQEVDKTWKEAFLANKKNYDVDGLPTIGKPPVLKKNGLYENGSPAIRGVDDAFVADEVAKRSSKPWVDNLADEAGTGIRVNGYVFDVMEELERLGKSVIPKKSKIISERSKYDSYIRAREMARGLRDEKFYNRMSNDKFARTYADTTALQWQGDDINRGLMMFDRGVKMGTTGEADFARNFMNVAGFDKLPMKTRIKLFNKIDQDLLLRTAKDPIKNDWWYTETDWLKSGIIKNLDGIDGRDLADVRLLIAKANPADEGAFQMLAMIKERSEMIKFVRSGNKIDDFVSHLPSQRDGTTNVLQHFAGISRDKSIASAVNMLPDDKVADAYIQLRVQLEKLAKAMDDSNPLKKLIDIPELTHAQSRKSVKKGLMTVQYNAGAKTIGESYFEALSGVSKIIDDATSLQVKRLGKEIMLASEELFPEATKVRHLLNQMAEAHEIAGKSAIEIKTSMGFPFKQSYKKTTTRTVELVDSSGKVMKLEVRVVLDEIDFAKQNRAFAPNVIHMMDATHKSLVVEALKKAGIKDFSMIHDSFGTHFGNMDLLLVETKKAFLEMYKGKNFMNFLADEFESQGVAMKRYVRNSKGMKVRNAEGDWIIEDIPLGELNAQGSYNFEEFMNLEYFFH